METRALGSAGWAEGRDTHVKVSYNVLHATIVTDWQALMAITQKPFVTIIRLYEIT